jgi:hypothetical protein
MHGYRLSITYTEYGRYPIGPCWSSFKALCKGRLRKAVERNLKHQTRRSGVSQAGRPIPGGRASLLIDVHDMLEAADEGFWPWGRHAAESLRALRLHLIEETWREMLPKKPRARPARPSPWPWAPIPRDPHFEPRPEDDPAHYGGFLDRILNCPTQQDMATHI